MPSHYNCCVPLCNNHKRKNPNLSFYRIPKELRIRKEYKRLIRNTTLKLQSSHTRICSEHFDGGKKRHGAHLPSIFPWSKPFKLRKPPTRRRLEVDDAASTLDLVNVEVGTTEVVVKCNLEKTAESVSYESISVSSDVICTESKETQTSLTGVQIEENEDYLKRLEEKVSALQTVIQNREFSITLKMLL